MNFITATKLPMTAWVFAISASLIYLCCSLSASVILSRCCKLKDPRYFGSNNPGATNVLRLSGKRAALAVFLFDVSKGFFPLLIIQWLYAIQPPELTWLAWISVLGHCFSIFLNFKGGKGIATSLGVLLALSPLAAIALWLTWLVILYLWRYVSLASLISVVLLPCYVTLFDPTQDLWALLSLSAVIVYQHRSNIKRLLVGQEHPLNFKKKD